MMWRVPDYVRYKRHMILEEETDEQLLDYAFRACLPRTGETWTSHTARWRIGQHLKTRPNEFVVYNLDHTWRKMPQFVYSDDFWVLLVAKGIVWIDRDTDLSTMPLPAHYVSGEEWANDDF